MVPTIAPPTIAPTESRLSEKQVACRLRVLADALRLERLGPLTLMLAPGIVVADPKKLLTIRAAVTTADTSSPVFCPVVFDPVVYDVVIETLLPTARRAVLVPAPDRTIGAGTLRAAQRAVALGKPLFAFDQQYRLLTSRFELRPFAAESRTNSRSARVVFLPPAATQRRSPRQNEFGPGVTHRGLT